MWITTYWGCVYVDLRYTSTMFVLTVDQQGSRTARDRVPELLSALKGVPTVLPFVRTVGDEAQAVLDSASHVVHACIGIARASKWSVGIGIGEVEKPLPDSSDQARGEAFIAARGAVEAAKNSWSPLCVHTATSREEVIRDSHDAQTVLRLLFDLIARATDTQWRVIDAFRDAPSPSQADIAQSLGISQQAVSKSLRAGRAAGIMEAIDCAERLLHRAHQPWETHAH